MSETGQLAGAMARALEVRIRAAAWTPLSHQIPPPGDWRGWFMLGGRGTGKTAACAKYMTEHVKGPPCLPGPNPHWMGIIGPTLDDAGRSCFSGPSGIKSFDPSAQKHTTNEGTIIRWPNGSEAKLFGTDTEKSTDRLRSGGNTCLVWCEELAAWRWLDLAWAHMVFGLRVGPHPRWIASTTPKPRPKIKELAAPPRGVVKTHGTTRDNPYLAPDVRAELEESYLGTQLGEQELLGLILDEDKNALWTRAVIAANRIDVDDLPLLTRRAVAVDPSGGAGEQGIIAAGRADFPRLDRPLRPEIHGYLLADRSGTFAPDVWGRRAIELAIEIEADAVVFESDYGRDMPKAVLAGAADELGISIPIVPALASTIGNKRARAFPFSALAPQGRFHHVGVFEALEDQMATWTEESGYSPDRLDAATWDAWYLKLVSTASKMTSPFGGAAAAGRSLALHRG